MPRARAVPAPAPCLRPRRLRAVPAPLFAPGLPAPGGGVHADVGHEPTGLVGRGPPPGLTALTARAAEVLKLVARGLSNADAADRLFISEATVKTHLNRTMTSWA